MNYLRSEWENYNDAANQWYRLMLVLLSVTEDIYRSARLPWQGLRPLFWLRGYITGGKTRRLLRRVVKHWAKHGIFESQLFDCSDRALMITFQWVDIRAMKGYQNDVQ